MSDKPSVLTAEEFERRYAESSGMTVADLRFLGRVVLPCRCGAPGCEGWQSLPAELADDPVIRWQAGVGERPDVPCA